GPRPSSAGSRAQVQGRPEGPGAGPTPRRRAATRSRAGEHLDTVEDAVGVVRGGDEHPFAYLWPAATLEWEQVGREHAWGLRHPIALVAQGLDDDVPLVPVSWTGQVPDVLEDDKRRVVRLDDLEDVPVQGAQRLLHAALGAGLGDGLAR